jgi:hypothetical protein
MFLSSLHGAAWLRVVGGLLNATFGNATELIVAIFALKEGLLRVVQVRCRAVGATVSILRASRWLILAIDIDQPFSCPPPRLHRSNARVPGRAL